SNWVSPTATTTTRSRGPRASEPTTFSAGLLAPPIPGMRLASQPSSRMKPITSSNVTTVVPTMPAPVCGVPKDTGAAWVLAVVATGRPAANAVAAVRGAAVAVSVGASVVAGVSALAGIVVPAASTGSGGGAVDSGNGSTMGGPAVAVSVGASAVAGVSPLAGIVVPAASTGSVGEAVNSGNGSTMAGPAVAASGQVCAVAVLPAMIGEAFIAVA